MLKTTISDVLPGCENLCTHSKVCSSNEKSNEITKSSFKCGKSRLNYKEGPANGSTPGKNVYFFLARKLMKKHSVLCLLVRKMKRKFIH